MKFAPIKVEKVEQTLDLIELFYEIVLTSVVSVIRVLGWIRIYRNLLFMSFSIVGYCCSSLLINVNTLYQFN